MAWSSLTTLRIAAMIRRCAIALERSADAAESTFRAYERDHPQRTQPSRRAVFGVATVQDFNDARERERNEAIGGGFGAMPPDADEGNAR
jgi:hypothetical protein